MTPQWAGEPYGLDDACLGGAQPVDGFAWVGTPELSWLGRDDLADIPWFISRRRLDRQRRWPHAKGMWAMDSGAYTEASMFGQWTITVDQYLDTVRRAAGEIGNLAWVAPMDLCCEPDVVARVAAQGWLAEQVRWRPGMPDDPVFPHLIWTVRNFLELRSRLDRRDDPHVIPVVQGWTLDHYQWCLELYEMAGVDLTDEVLVGIGSTCRRNADLAILAKLGWLAEAGIRRVHAFGLKSSAASFAVSFGRVASFDSTAWSYAARRHGRPFHDDATHRHCGNCPVAARAWFDRQQTSRRATTAAVWDGMATVWSWV